MQRTRRWSTVSTQHNISTRRDRPSPGRHRIWTMFGTAIVLALSLAVPNPAAAHTRNLAGHCPHGSYCTGGPDGPFLHLYWTHGGFSTTLDGSHWPVKTPIHIRLLQTLGFQKPLRFPAVTGLVVVTDSRGRLRIVMPDQGRCSFAAAVLVRAAGQAVQLPKHKIVCMEGREPNPPVENFRVAVGRYIRAIYVRSHAPQRYTLALSPVWPAGPVLSWSRALDIARRAAKVGPSASVSATRGGIGIGPAGESTGVWEVWVGGVHVPGYGHGHRVVLVTMSTQAGVAYPHRGTVIASWFAP